MFIILFIAAFETILFPHNIFCEEYFNPAAPCDRNLCVSVRTTGYFGISGLRSYALHSSVSSYTLSISSFGDDIYKENVLACGGHFAVIDKLHIGFSLGLLNQWIKDSESRLCYTIKGGCVYRNGPVSIGGWINNLNRPKLSSVDCLPQSFALRLDFVTNQKLQFIFALRELATQVPFFNVGVLYAPSKIAAFGIGANTDPPFLEGSVDVTIGSIGFRYVGTNHRHVGLSHTFYMRFKP